MNVQSLAAAVLALAGTIAAAQPKPAPATPAARPAPAAAPAPVAAGTFALKPGLWETTLATETAGSLTKRSTVGRVCYAATDVADLRRVLPRQREADMKCENSDAKTQGTTVTWKVSCTSKDDAMTGTGELTSTVSAYTGKAELQLKKKGVSKPAKVSQTFSGRWVDNCK